MSKSNFRSYIKPGTIFVALVFLLNIVLFTNVQISLAGSNDFPDLSIQETVYAQQSVIDAVYEGEPQTFTLSGTILGTTESDIVEIMLSTVNGEVVVTQTLAKEQSEYTISGVPAGEYKLCVHVNGATSAIEFVRVDGHMTVPDIELVPVRGTLAGLSEGVSAFVYFVPENKNGMVMPLTVLSNGNETEFVHILSPGNYHMIVKAEGYEDFVSPDTITVNEDEMVLDPVEMVIELKLLTSTLPTGSENKAYFVELQATGGKEPFTWSISNGSLPRNLTLDNSSGVISGTPYSRGDYTFEVTVTDSYGHTDSRNFNISVARRSSGGDSSSNISSSGSSSTGTDTTFSDPELQEVINNAEETVTLVAPAGITSLTITWEQYNLLMESGKDIVILIQGVQIVLDPTVINLPDDARLNFKVEEITEDTAANLVSDTDYQLIGKIFDISIEVSNADPQGEYPQKQSVRLSLPVESAFWLDNSHYRFDVFYYNEELSQWEPMQAVHDPNNQVLTFDTPHLSKYAVLQRPVKEFLDINGHWGQEDIEKMAAQGIVGGYDDQSFKPDKNITRAEFTAFLTRLMGIDGNVNIKFTDVAEKDWHYKSIGNAYKAQIVGGYEDGSFKPNQYITREQVAAVISNALDYAGINPEGNDVAWETFSDARSISPWAKQSVAMASEMGIVRGVPSNDGRFIFAPAKYATRAEAAVMLNRLTDIYESAKLNF
ncbi:MAG: hypothetical protein VR67_18120 [Peptococcaceae bacterium BRH_c8a]|nr:MAG: hypothetical protein VR67_18120 [Peptococcaceae bacterium BRH_c8a]